MPHAPCPRCLPISRFASPRGPPIAAICWVREDGTRRDATQFPGTQKGKDPHKTTQKSGAHHETVTRKEKAEKRKQKPEKRIRGGPWGANGCSGNGLVSASHERQRGTGRQSPNPGCLGTEEENTRKYYGVCRANYELEGFVSSRVNHCRETTSPAGFFLPFSFSLLRVRTNTTPYFCGRCTSGLGFTRKNQIWGRSSHQSSSFVYAIACIL